MINLKDFKLYLLKMRDCDNQGVKKINEAYSFWHTIWEKELVAINSEVRNWGEEFYRHDHVLFITYNDQAVGLHLYGSQHLDNNACLEQSYFSAFNEEFLSSLQNANIRQVFSASWLSVNPAFAKLDKNIIFSKVILALAGKISQLYNRQGIIGPTRRDNGMAQKAIEWGGISYGQKTVRNVPCDLIYVPSSVVYPLTEMEQQLINFLWNGESEDEKIAA